MVSEYPHVSKALRDLHKKKTGKIAKDVPFYHLCSISMIHGTGHPDLDAILSFRSPVIFDIELLKVEQPGKYKMDQWAMSESEKSHCVPKLKEQGNKLYREGKIDKACELYFEALCYVEEALMREKPESFEWKNQVEKKIPLLLNYAQCKLLMEDYVETIRQCSAVIVYDPSNVKAFFRRGKAYAAVWDVKEAKADFDKAVELDASLAKAAEREMKALMERVKEKDIEEKLRLKGKMFK